MPNLLDRVSRVTLDLLFPPQCAVCGGGGSLLCDDCATALPAADGARCARCWMPHRGTGECRHCLDAPPAFASLRAAYIMEGGARRLAHELKYEGLTSLAEPMARLIAPHVDAATVDLIVPVPLHPRRERSRGYNQAAELAKRLATLMDRTCDTRAARRIRDTAPLGKTMHREERRAIVAGAFEARAERVDGRRVLLVDDVVTTGATLDSCARALVDAGAIGVRCAVWARAD